MKNFYNKLREDKTPLDKKNEKFLILVLVLMFFATLLFLSTCYDIYKRTLSQNKFPPANTVLIQK